MDSNNTNPLRMEVDDIDDEVYYREQIGCKVKLENIGSCATATCPDGQLQFCQKPGENKTRQVSNDSYGVYDYESC
jgi:hypothetical protein